MKPPSPSAGRPVPGPVLRPIGTPAAREQWIEAVGGPPAPVDERPAAADR